MEKEKKGFLGGLLGGKKKGCCCCMEIVEEPESPDEATKDETEQNCCEDGEKPEA